MPKIVREPGGHAEQVLTLSRIDRRMNDYGPATPSRYRRHELGLRDASLAHGWVANPGAPICLRTPDR